MIQLHDISFSYDGIPALNHISFDLPKGCTAVLEGPNGCGKSTLLKMLNGLIFAEYGEYFFDGTAITKDALRSSQFSKKFHQRIGFIFQNPDIQLFCASVEEEIAFGPQQMGLSNIEVKQRTEDCIQMLGLQKLRDRAPYHMSTGEKRKTAIACILSMNPDVLVLDEPMSGLDEASKHWLTDFLQSLKQTDKTILIATHDKSFADSIADIRFQMNESHEFIK